MSKFISLLAGFFTLAHVCNAGTVNANFTSASPVPVTAASYTATGNDVGISLGFAPPTGTNLTIVNITGLPFISGRFSNLPHGQTVDLTYGAKSYRFVANYYGGTGNDLILQWAYQDLTTWGHNGSGRLGNNSTINSSLPVSVVQSGVMAGKIVVLVAAGSNHNIALCSDGTLVAWGYNNYGQLGNSSTIDSGVPVLIDRSGVLTGKTVVSLAAKGNHSLALCSDGTLAAWGSNAYGQLGNNSTTNSSVPVLVNRTGVLAGKTVVSVVAGYSYSLALCSDGVLAAWGNNTVGQLGNNSTTNSSVPVLVDRTVVLAGKTVVSVKALENHNLALCSDGTLAAWGYNNYGQLGNSSTTDSGVPVLVNQTGVLAGKTVVFVAGDGGRHTLALCSDGTVSAWGLNASGQLGNNSTTNSSVPVLANQTGVLAGKTVVSVAGGNSHSLALCSDGTVAAWGLNSSGQLGNNSTTNMRVPTLVIRTGVLADKTVVSVGTGGDHNVALASVSNSPDLSGLSLSVGNLSPIFEPATTSYGTSVSYENSFITVTPTSASNTASVRVNNSLVTSGSASQAIPLVTGMNAITIVITMLDGVTTKTYTVSVTRLPASSIASLSGLVPSSGTLGPAFSSGTTSYAVSVANSVSSVSVRPSATDATATIKVNGVPVMFGTNSAPLPLVAGPNTITVLVTAQDGITTSTYTITITRVLLEANFTSNSTIPITAASYIATGNEVAISLGFTPPTGTNLTIIKNTGLAFISGRFSKLTHGQDVILPYNGIPYKFVVNYYGGTGNDLVLQWAFQDIVSWGDNGSGQLGNNSTTNSRVPVLVNRTGVLAGKTVVSVVAGESHSLALCSDGTLAAWGDNGSGQLGNNSTTNSSVPVLVDQSGVLAGKTVISVAAGTSHSIALCSDGTIAGWGSKNAGQLAHDTRLTMDTLSPTPVLVVGNEGLAGKTVVSVSAGGLHTLALCSDGTIAGWGRYAYISSANEGVPGFVDQTGVLSGKTVIAISAGEYHNLALCSDGTMVTWGDNTWRQLGTGADSPGLSISPVLVSKPASLSSKTVTSICAGIDYNFVLCSDGTRFAWGNGSERYRIGGVLLSVPALMNNSEALTDKTVVSLSHFIALCSDGTLVTWGWNSYGALGDNSTTNVSNVPLLVNQSGPMAGRTGVSVAAGSNFRLAMAAIPNSSELAGLSLTSGSLNETFSPTVTAYTSNVSNTTTQLRVKPIAAYSTASILVNGNVLNQFGSSDLIPLAGGFNNISVAVTAQDGVTTTTYTVAVTRAPSTISTLSSLFPSAGDLSPAFSESIASYAVSVPNTATSTKLMLTTADDTATVRVNEVALISGETSPAFPLAIGSNLLLAVVTAQDGITTTTYTIFVTRAGSRYDFWKESVFSLSERNDLSVSGEQASPAGDGITNLMKYAVALDPKVCGTGGLPTAGARDGYLTLTYRKNKLASDVTYTVMAGEALSGNGWSEAITVVSQADEGDYWLVTVRDNVTQAGHPMRFMRLTVTK